MCSLDQPGLCSSYLHLSFSCISCLNFICQVSPTDCWWGEMKCSAQQFTSAPQCCSDQVLVTRIIKRQKGSNLHKSSVSILSEFIPVSYRPGILLLFLKVCKSIAGLLPVPLKHLLNLLRQFFETTVFS